MQFDPELLSDQRRRGWGDRQLTSLGIETRADGSLMVSVAVERVDGKVLRWVVLALKRRRMLGKAGQKQVSVGMSECRWRFCCIIAGACLLVCAGYGIKC